MDNFKLINSRSRIKAVVSLQKNLPSKKISSLKFSASQCVCWQYSSGFSRESQSPQNFFQRVLCTAVLCVVRKNKAVTWWQIYISMCTSAALAAAIYSLTRGWAHFLHSFWERPCRIFATEYRSGKIWDFYKILVLNCHKWNRLGDLLSDRSDITIKHEKKITAGL